MKIAVVGAGYVGLTVGTCLAYCGNEVRIIEVDLKRLDMLRMNKLPIHEKRMDGLFVENRKEGRIKLYPRIDKRALEGVEAIIVTVGTPSNNDGSVDISQVESAMKNVMKYAKKGTLIILKSTVPPGTTKKYAKASKGFLFAHWPEFLQEGNAVSNFLNPDRVVFGTGNKRAEKKMCEIYHSIYKYDSNHSTKLYLVSTMESELAKYASNCFLAARIALANEFSRICVAHKASIYKVMTVVGSDQRIGEQFLEAGIGFGGSCFPKDVKAIAKFANDKYLATPILDKIMISNSWQLCHFFEVVCNAIEKSERRVAIWGLGFKPGTDDVRDSPALRLASALIAMKIKVHGWDSLAGENAKKAEPKIKIYKTQRESLNGASCLIVNASYHLVDFMTNSKSSINVDLQLKRSIANLKKRGIKTVVVTDNTHFDLYPNGFLCKKLSESGIDFYSLSTGLVRGKRI